MSTVSSSSSDPWEVEVFYDGECRLCAGEIDMLKRRNKRNLIRFTDIADPDFDAASYGFDHQTLMARIHARTRNGEWIEGVEVFRRLYTAIGLGPIVQATRLPGIRWALDRGYDIFARNRLRLTGRCENGVCDTSARTKPQAPSTTESTTA